MSLVATPVRAQTPKGDPGGATTGVAADAQGPGGAIIPTEPTDKSAPDYAEKKKIYDFLGIKESKQMREIAKEFKRGAEAQPALCRQYDVSRQKLAQLVTDYRASISASLARALAVKSSSSCFNAGFNLMALLASPIAALKCSRLLAIPRSGRVLALP